MLVVSKTGNGLTGNGVTRNRVTELFFRFFFSDAVDNFFFLNSTNKTDRKRSRNRYQVKIRVKFSFNHREYRNRIVNQLFNKLTSVFYASVIDHEFRHPIFKVAVDPQTTLTML